MKRMVGSAAVALALLMSAEAGAQSRIVLGGGNADCETLLDNGSFQVSNPNMQWYLGYISAAANFGMALSGGETQLSQRLDQLSNSAIIGRARAYCSSNPSHYLDDAASHFVSTSGS